MVMQTGDEVRATRYVDLLAALSESNLPPGGLATVRELAVNTHLRPGQRALHAGCNAGYLSREVARRTGCSVLGVDISEPMVLGGNLRASQEGLTDLVRHERHDIRSTTMPDAAFDVVFSGGALAFIDGHAPAVAEMVRLTRPSGMLADAQFYYHEQPRQSVLDAVAEVIEVPVPVYTRDYWLSLYASHPLREWFRSDRPAAYRSDAEIDDYCAQMIILRAAEWGGSAKEALLERLQQMFRLFNENMKYLSSTTYVYRRDDTAEPALFT
jgi:SAM-dependent methyltransferase